MNFDNLVAVLAVAAAVPLILAAVPRVAVPGPVLEIVAGIVLGPAVLGLVKPDQAVQPVRVRGGQGARGNEPEVSEDRSLPG